MASSGAKGGQVEETAAPAHENGQTDCEELEPAETREEPRGGAATSLELSSKDRKKEKEGELESQAAHR